jgi:phosphatidate cytidylyltransferase
MLKHRLLSGILIALALVAAVFFLSSFWAVMVLLLVSSLAAWEFYSMLEAAKIPHFKILGTVSCILLIMVTAWTLSHPTLGISASGEAVALFLIIAGVLLRQFPQKENPRPLETMAGTLMGILYAGFLFNFFTRLLLTWGLHDGRLLVLYVIAIAKATDIGAYFIGCSFGRHKLIPRISPAKTWEGVLGGIAFGLLISFLFYLGFRGHFHWVAISLTDSLVLGFILALCAIVGDLTESLFKRAAGVKDSGRLILGMGGVLDVVDSLMFAAPALYIYTSLFLSTLR